MSTQEHNYLWQAREKVGLEGRQESSATSTANVQVQQHQVFSTWVLVAIFSFIVF